MQIAELIIRNFGKFTNKTIRLSDGIQLIYGENESGKSTIHAFIRGMLFGIERKRGRAASNDTYTQYEPWENPGYYSGVMRFESGGKYFCIRREFDKSSKKVQLICEDDGEELSVEHGDLEMLLGGVTAASYDNTVSIGQLKAETDRTLADELRDFATNYYAGGGDDMNLTGAFGQLKERKRELERELRAALQEKQKQREHIEQEASFLWRDIHKLREEQRELEEEIAIRREQEKEKTDKETQGRGVIDEIRPEKWRIHPLELLVFAFIIILPMFILHKPWNYLMSIILFLSCGIYVWNRMKEGKRQEKTEPEKLLEEITPEGEKASVEKLQWEYAHKKADLKEREIEYANIQEQIEELDEVSEPVKEIEKNHACVQFAIEKLEELSGNLEKKMGDSLNEQVSSIIREITGGKYTRLIVEDQLKMSLISDGRKIPVSQVSRGTIEQIYFALRMSATEVLGREELPVLLDDTFAYYDDVRLENTLKWLAKNKKQVLIFTCQKREEMLLNKLHITYRKEEV